MRYLITKLIKKKGSVIMIFTPTSPVVKAWVSMILAGVYTREDVPNLWNLKEVVYAILDSMV